MGDQVLSLKWNNHQSSFNKKIENIFNKDKFTDVTIACDEKLYPAHKLVLSTCSEYFDKMFSRLDSKNLVIVLKDITQKNIEMLLNYMYLGEVNVDQAELPSLMKAAECLRIKGLAVSDNEEEKPKKRKLPPDNSSFKRKHTEYSQNNRKNSVSTDEPVSTQSPIKYRKSKNIEISPASPQPLITEDVKDIKVEKIDPSEEQQYYDSSASNVGCSSVGSFIEESYIKPIEPLQMEAFSDYTCDSFEPGPPDEVQGEYSPTQAYPSVSSANMHSCSECNYQTVSRTNLAKHSFVHSGEYPFSCKFCSFKTRQKGNLKGHLIRIHKQNKNGS